MNRKVTLKRGSVGLKQGDMSTISAATSEQPCDSFGVTNLFSSARDLYESGDLTFFAKILESGSYVFCLNWMTIFSAGLCLNYLIEN